ncbi:MAG: sporulation protein YqfD [Clostridiales bacterium]|nr:sporulation protein YqfD [Clostridiales bacterium]
MIKFIKFFRGYLCVLITGPSTERFLNLCSRMNIVLWNLIPTSDGYEFYISRRAFGMIGSALEKTGTHIVVLKKIGLPFLAKKYRKHSFFLIGIFLALFLLFYMSLFIWKVEIEGNSYYSTQTILRYLKENGIGYASFKEKINCKELQNMLRKEFEDMTWVSAKIEGTKLYLVVQERIKGSETASSGTFAEESDNGKEENNDIGETGSNELPADDRGTDLLASNTGIVESLIVRSGIPLVKAGDAVEKGDTLVTGAIEITDDYGGTASYHLVESDADAKIRTSLSYQDSFSVLYEEKTLTGEEKWGIAFYFDSRFFCAGRLPAEDNYIEINRIFPVVIGRDFYLPFQVEKTQYLEYITEEKSYTKEEAETLARERLNAYCKNLEENGVQILSNSVIIEQDGEDVHVNGDLTALVKQNDYREISVDEMEEELSNGIDTADDGDPD